MLRFAGTFREFETNPHDGQRTLATRTRDPRPWRWLLAGVLVAGVALVAIRYPAVPDEPWPEPEAYRPDEALCRADREARQWTGFEVPSTPVPVTAAEVARRFNLETAPVCRANDVADCDGTPLPPGRRLVLPLSADPAAVATARDAARGDGG